MSKKGLIGVQMSTIAPAKMPSFEPFEVMGRLTDIGFHCAEVSQVPMTKENVAGFRKAIDELNFNISSLTASISPMVPGMPGEYLCNEDDFKKMVADAKALDCDMMRIGAMPIQNMLDFNKAVDFAKEADECAHKLREHGIDLYYHNHHFEFIRFADGKTTMDYLYEGLNPETISFCLDTHWVQRGGGNPTTWVEKLAGRIPCIHLKDVDVQVNKPVTAPVGWGNLDFDAILAACADAEADYLLVEQDDCFEEDPFDCLKKSYDFLHSKGLE